VASKFRRGEGGGHQGYWLVRGGILTRAQKKLVGGPTGKKRKKKEELEGGVPNGGFTIRWKSMRDGHW